MSDRAVQSELSAARRRTRWRWAPWSAALLTGMLGAVWLLTSITMVAPDESGLVAHCGTLGLEALEPGVHWHWPWPWERILRVSTRKSHVVPLGFRAQPGAAVATEYLWTTSHGQEEFPLLTGSTTELVVVNALLTYRIEPTADALREFHTTAIEPELVLVALAEQALTREVGSRTASELLNGDMRVLADEWRETLAQRVARSKLGLTITGLGIVSIHPPPEVAVAYLEVGNAYTDARRQSEEATLQARAELIRSAMMCDAAQADARAAAAGRRAEVAMNCDRVAAIANDYVLHPVVLTAQLQREEIAPLLAHRPILMLDAKLPENVEIWLGTSRAESPRRTTAP